jgi:hypothetical protein
VRTHWVRSCDLNVYSYIASIFLTWSLILWEEHTLRIFENKVLRRIMGPKREEVEGG